MSTSERSGTCLCGVVKITAKETPADIGACHCRMCRRWGGSAYLQLACGTEVSLEGEESISVFSSSEWAERGFCAQCGTHLFYRVKQGGQYHIPVGVFDDDVGLNLTSQIFIDKKPDYYGFAQPTHNMTEAEVLEMFSNPE